MAKNSESPVLKASITLLTLALFALIAVAIFRYLSETEKNTATDKPPKRPPALAYPNLSRSAASLGLADNAPVFIRIFKEEAQLELYIRGPDGFRLLRRDPICAYSGTLGPKLREGDRQAPEGFYEVRLGALNPNSSYHLSFNLGFPNRFDRAHGRTGSYLMVHGDCVSVGCYAMTDAVIEPIYKQVERSLKAGQPFVPVHIFPFRMSNARLTQAANTPQESQWLDFWRQLAPAYHQFEHTQRVPRVSVSNKRYNVAPNT